MGTTEKGIPRPGKNFLYIPDSTESGPSGTGDGPVDPNLDTSRHVDGLGRFLKKLHCLRLVAEERLHQEIRMTFLGIA